MTKRKRFRTIDVISWIILPVLFIIQAYAVVEKIRDEHLEINVGFILWIIGLIMTITMLMMALKIAKSKRISLSTYASDTRRDEYTFRKRKRKQLTVMFIAQGLIIALLIITAVFKI
jgi:hypothetical protein